MTAKRTTNGAGEQVQPHPGGISDADDISKLWIDPGIGDPLTVEHIHKIPLGKPRDFFRTVPDKSYRQLAAIYVHKSENQVEPEFFLVDPAMYGKIEEARPTSLITTVDRIGAPRLWPIPGPRDGEKDNAAWGTARAIAKEGLTFWVKLVWRGRAYVSRVADPGYAPDPDFGRLPPFEELVRMAFGPRGIIRSEDHPVFRDLFGKVTPPDPDSDDPLV